MIQVLYNKFSSKLIRMAKWLLEDFISQKHIQQMHQ